MNESNILRLACEPEWYAKCYQEYLDSCAEDYQNLLAAISDAATSDEFTDFPDGIPDDQFDPNSTEVIDRITELANTYNLQLDTPLAVGDGFTTVRNALTLATQAATTHSLSLDSVSSTASQLMDGAGALISSTISANQMIDALKSNYQATVVTAAGFLASAKSTIADRISCFENTLKTRVQEGVSNLSSTTNSVRSLLNRAPDVLSFAQNILSTSMTPGLTTDGSTDTYANTDVSQYTGANPLIAADFSSVQKAASTVIKTGAKVVAGVFNGLLSLGKSLFKKAEQLVSDAVLNPEVLKKIDGGDGVGLVNGFQYQHNTDVTINVTHAIGVALIDAKTAGVFDNYMNHWVQFRTFGGESLINISSINITGDGLGFLLTFSGQFLFKPHLLNSKTLSGIYSNYHISRLPALLTSSNAVDQTTGDASTVINVLNDLRKSPSIYGSIDMDNLQTYQGYGMATELHSAAIQWGALEIAEKVFGTYQYSDVFNTTPTQLTFSSVGKTAENTNNLDLVMATSGYYSGSGTFDHSPGGGPSSTPCLTFEKLLCFMLVAQAYDRYAYPTDWTFIPYSNNSSNFSEPDFEINNDSTIQNSVTTIVTAAIVVVIVAVVAITALTVVKKIARARYFKNTKKVGELDAKMWDGQKLTASEQRRYLRSSKKIANSKVCDFSSDVGGSPEPQAVTLNSSDISLIATLLK